MVTTTTTYSFKKPTVGDDEDVWGGYLNDSMDLIDDVLDGTTPVTGIDINSGTIGGVTVDGTLSFGDSVKANFGASSDMQLFHDGTNSILGITNTHTGKISNVTDNEDFITFTPNNAVKILHNNSEVFTTQTAGVSITGNIAVSGTVDGRDIATDGTKLDGIESGATADQTKADIDALGIAASTAATLATARNIALSGDVSGSASFDGSANISITATVANNSHTHTPSNITNLIEGTTFSGTYPVLFGIDETTGRIFENNSITFNGTTNVLTINGGTAWHSGNDGSGSGLDADLWDGNQFSSYLNQAVLTTSSPTFSNAYIGTYVYHSGDTNSYLGWSAADDFRIVVGGRQILRCDEGTNPDKIQFYDSSNFINTSGVFQVAGTSQSAAQIEGYSALSGTTPSINVTSAGGFSLTMSGNTTFTFTGATSGKSQGFVLQLTGNGSTVTWPTSVDWAGGTAPDAPASGETDIYVFWTRDGGTTWYGVQSIDAAA